MSRDVPPAISRTWNSEDSDVSIERTLEDNVSFHRGLGETGYTVERTDKECPCCYHKKMVRQHNRYPDDFDRVKYWCLSPTCSFFVADRFSFLRGLRTEPMVTE
jgi:hypothetical protein